MTVIKFSNPGNNNPTKSTPAPTFGSESQNIRPKYHNNPDNNPTNQMDLYSQLLHSRDSDKFTMIIGDNTYVASKQAMLSVLSYYIGMMKMREMSLLTGFGEMPHPPVNPPDVRDKTPNTGEITPPPCPNSEYSNESAKCKECNTPKRSNRNIKK